MMKIKLLFSLIVFILSYNITNGQELRVEQHKDTTELTNVLTKFISWIEDIDDILMKIDDKEKLKRIYRKLGNASIDIDNIILEKEDLANKIMILDEITRKDINNLQPLVWNIIQDVEDLNINLNDLKMELSSTDQIEVDQIMGNVRISSNTNRILMLDDIQGFLFGYDNPLKELKKTVEESNLLSKNLMDMVQDAKTKIKSKINTL
ncbi:hypothetical protein [Psychroserpens sp. MEBiC05023]